MSRASQRRSGTTINAKASKKIVKVQYKNSSQLPKNPFVRRFVLKKIQEARIAKQSPDAKTRSGCGYRKKYNASSSTSKKKTLPKPQDSSNIVRRKRINKMKLATPSHSSESGGGGGGDSVLRIDSDDKSVAANVTTATAATITTTAAKRQNKSSPVLSTTNQSRSKDVSETENVYMLSSYDYQKQLLTKKDAQKTNLWTTNTFKLGTAPPKIEKSTSLLKHQALGATQPEPISNQPERWQQQHQPNTTTMIAANILTPRFELETSQMIIQPSIHPISAVPETYPSFSQNTRNTARNKVANTSDNEQTRSNFLLGQEQSNQQQQYQTGLPLQFNLPVQTEEEKSNTFVSTTTQLLDFVIVCDTTSGMRDYLSACTRILRVVFVKLTEVFKDALDLNFAFVAYRDHPPEEDTYVTRVHDLGSLRSCLEFVEGLEASGGGDTPEAVLDGLAAAALQISWREKSLRYVLHIADAPPHGDVYCQRTHNLLERSFMWRHGCPCGLSAEKVASFLNTLRVRYRLIKVGDLLEKMSLIFAQCFDDYKEIAVNSTFNLDLFVTKMLLQELLYS